jgi:hypothetical protein
MFTPCWSRPMAISWQSLSHIDIEVGAELKL